jgi:hypothetical protein
MGKFCLDMEEECGERLGSWLKKKGVAEEYAHEYPFNTQIFITFVYRYMHEDLVLLKSVPEEYFEEFFFDYVLRKVMVIPHEYVLFMPALKLFYQFLAEKKYIDNPEPVLEILDDMEEEFIDELRERYR